MSDQRLAHLVRALIKQSEDGKITWGTTASEGVYQVSFPRQSIQIALRPNAYNPAADDVMLAIRNANGTVVEQFADTDITDYMPNALELMTRLYEKARRQALGADKAIDEILDELDDEIPF